MKLPNLLYGEVEESPGIEKVFSNVSWWDQVDPSDGTEEAQPKETHSVW